MVHRFAKRGNVSLGNPTERLQHSIAALVPVMVAFALLLVPARQVASAENGAVSRAAPIPLGTLEPFWRYSAALGPFHETGQALVEIPDYMLHGDFAYRKRPYPKEVPFADHLSLVRLLGGFAGPKGKSDAGQQDRDLAYRDADGKIRYRMELLRPRLAPYLDNGYTSLTLVMDNVPWCFPEHPRLGAFGQCAPPRDPAEWRDFIKTLCRELVKIMGRDAANRLRFRVGTENNGRQRFDGTYDDFVRHYDHTAAAILEVLPGAKVGPFNISGASVRGIASLHNVNAFRLAEHCFRERNLADGRRPTPFDWVAFSRYYRPGEDPEANARVCQEVWDEFERRVPELKGVSREIHEFGIAPFGEAAKGQFVSSEPGALGTALTCQMMFRMREAGIQRLWHWGVFDRFRDRQRQLRYLPTGDAWLMCVMDQMAGGQAYLLPPLDRSAAGTQHLAAASFRKDSALLMISAYHTDVAQHATGLARFRIPSALFRPAARPARFVRLTRATSIGDQIRRDFESARLLRADFMSRPDRLGSVREMGEGRAAESLVGDRWNEYIRQWQESLALKPLDPSVGELQSDADGSTLAVRLAPPEVLVIQLDGQAGRGSRSPR